MSIIYGNSRLLAKDAAKRFLWQHCSIDGRWSTERDAKIYENLLALGPDPDPALIEKMLDEGADLSLTRRECSSCGEHATRWVYITVATSDDQDEDIILCDECISRAATTMVLGEEKP